MKQKSDEPQFDIILVGEFFRTLTYYFSIIKYLGPSFRIGLYEVAIDEKLMAKNASAHGKFIQRCKDFGVEIVSCKPVTTKLLLIPQRTYVPEATEDIRNNIRAKTIIGALGLAWPGLNDQFILDHQIRKVWVIHRRFMDFLLSHRGDRSIYDGCELTEVGLPFNRYPVFNGFSADYLLAMPTPFSFAHEKDKWLFLETVLRLLDQMQPADIVVHKAHNATDYDNFLPLKYRRFVRGIQTIPGCEALIKRCAHALSYAIGGNLAKFYTAYLYERVLRRVTPMEAVTTDHAFAMEAFLPGVRKGVIGGLSNTIWGALYSQLPFYNCVDLSRQNRHAADRLFIGKDPSQHLDLNLKFFLVPFCRGTLNFDSKHFDIIDESARQGDLIQALKQELHSV